jgi:hypothetical protein
LKRRTRRVERWRWLGAGRPETTKHRGGAHGGAHREREKEKRVGGAEGRKRGRLGFASARMGFKRGGRSR